MTKEKLKSELPFLYKYAKVICFLSVVCILLYLFVIGFSIYHSMRPELRDKQLFTYEILQTSTFLYGLSEDTQFIFQNITKKEFEEKKDYLFKISMESRKANLPKLISQQLGYIALFILVFWAHRRIIKQHKV